METHKKTTDDADSVMGDASKHGTARKNRSGAARRRAQRARRAADPQTGGSAAQTGTLSHTVEAGSARAPLLGNKRPATTGKPSAPKGAERSMPGSSGGGRGRGKRKRLPGQTPPGAGHTQKRSRALPSKEGEDQGHEICVFLDGFPERLLTNAQQDAIQQRVAEAHDRALRELTPDGHPPRFMSHNFRRGALFVRCLDEHSRDWLVSVIQSLQLEGMVLRATAAADIPKPKRAVVHVQGPELEPEAVLARLEVNNPGLGTSRWLVYGSERVGFNTTRLIVGLWETSVQALAAVDYKPWYLLGRATVKLLGPQKSLDGEGKQGPS